ncbi:MAG: hypothetical protein J0H82_04400 [Alphaproteobacteria bacterium]|jgi:hypothetical protein|nr:hypothetical protein [Alphaproteobacteria bacterium]
MTRIRTLALTRGLSPRQADIAEIFVPLVKEAARIQRLLRAGFSHRRRTAAHVAMLHRDYAGSIDQRADLIIGRALNAAEVELCRQIHCLGVTLSARDGERLSTIVSNMAIGAPASGERRRAITVALVDFCRSAAPAPALKPQGAADAA